LSGTASVLRSSITPLCEAMKLERCPSCVLLELAVQICACTKENDENTWLLHNPKEVVGFDVAGLKCCLETPSSSCVETDFKCCWTLLNVDFNTGKRQYN